MKKQLRRAGASRRFLSYARTIVRSVECERVGEQTVGDTEDRRVGRRRQLGAVLVGVGVAIAVMTLGAGPGTDLTPEERMTALEARTAGLEERLGKLGDIDRKLDELIALRSPGAGRPLPRSSPAD